MENVWQLLSQHSMFGSLAAADWQYISGEGGSMALPAGGMLYGQGDNADSLYLIISGSLILRSRNRMGEQLGPLTAGEIVGAEAIIAGARYTHDSISVESAELWPLSAARLVSRLESRFDDALTMIAAQATHLRRMVKSISEYKLQSTSERLARYIVELADADSGPVEIKLPCEKRQLADQLGMAPATLSRTFAKLRSFGVEAGRKDRIFVADIARLWDLASHDDLELEAFG